MRAFFLIGQQYEDNIEKQVVIVIREITFVVGTRRVLRISHVAHDGIRVCGVSTFLGSLLRNNRFSVCYPIGSFLSIVDSTANSRNQKRTV